MENNKISVTTEELLGSIEWLDAKGKTITKIEDDRGGSGSWIIFIQSDLK
jgi:hypothetical protein